MTLLYILALFLALATPVHAEELENDPAFAPVYRGPQDFAVAKFGMAESVFVRAGLEFGYQMKDLIIPIFHDVEQIARPILEPYKQTMAKFIDNFNPQHIIDTKIDYKLINQSFSIFCAVGTNEEKYSGKIRVDEGVEDVQISENWQNSQPVMQYGYNANAFLGLVTKECTGGICNWNRAPMRMNNADPLKFCDYNERGVAHKPIENNIVKLAGFGIGPEVMLTMPITIIIGYDENDNPIYEESQANEAMRLTEETLHSNIMELGHYGDPEGEDVEKSPYTETVNTKTTGGWTMSYIPQQIRDTKILGNANEDYAYKVSFFPRQAPITAPNSIVNNMKVRFQQASCFVTPDQLINNVAIGDNKNTQIHINEDNVCAPEEEEQAGGWNCRTDLPELASETLNNAGQGWADNAIYTDACKTENAWKQCHSDVIDRAKKACVDPLFALTIWLHETGASNYACGEPLARAAGCTAEKCVEDFGIHTGSTPPEDFSAQLETFLTLDYSCPHTIQDWVSMYYIGNNCYADEPDKTKVDTYVTELQEIYTELGGGTLPSWPKGQCSN